MLLNRHADSHLLCLDYCLRLKYKLSHCLPYSVELNLSIYEGKDHDIKGLVVLNAYGLSHFIRLVFD
jgi:hypothetical protein